MFYDPEFADHAEGLLNQAIEIFKRTDTIGKKVELISNDIDVVVNDGVFSATVRKSLNMVAFVSYERNAKKERHMGDTNDLFWQNEDAKKQVNITQ
jgi:hypothetical protein